MTKLIRSALAVLAVNALSSPLAMAAPYDGSSAASAGLSAAQILRDYSSSSSGVYWIDADGAGGAAPVQMYADMATAGGGWMLVRHATNTGNWINVTDNLGGSAMLNPGQSTNPLSAQDWTVPFNVAGGDFLFATGDLASWGVLASADVFQAVSGDIVAPNATVKASFGTAVAAGGMTNVLNRYGSGSGGPEDPWVGFEGDHWANIGKMMYGEAGFGGAHAAYKNAHLGVNVFVRELNPPALPVPEPDTAGLMLAGGAVLAALLRRRRTRD